MTSHVYYALGLIAAFSFLGSFAAQLAFMAWQSRRLASVEG